MSPDGRNEIRQRGSGCYLKELDRDMLIDRLEEWMAKLIETGNLPLAKVTQGSGRSPTAGLLVVHYTLRHSPVCVICLFI